MRSARVSLCAQASKAIEALATEGNCRYLLALRINQSAQYHTERGFCGTAVGYRERTSTLNEKSSVCQTKPRRFLF